MAQKLNYDVYKNEKSDASTEFAGICMLTNLEEQ